MRVQYPGAIYHLMIRGDRRDEIFEDDEDRHRFLKTLARTCEKTGWQVHAYCLMPTAFVCLLQVPPPDGVQIPKHGFQTHRHEAKLSLYPGGPR